MSSGTACPGSADHVVTFVVTFVVMPTGHGAGMHSGWIGARRCPRELAGVIGRLRGRPREDQLAVHWNGKSWTVIAGPANPATAAVSLYTGIALDPSTGTPWAVGGQLQGGGENSTLSGALVQSWNGDTWVDEPTPNGSLPLDAVASADGHQIFAIRRPELQAAPIGGMSVGGVGPSSLLQWNGARWNTLLSNHGTLNSVGVVTSRDVWVVGVQHAEPLLMHWDGTSWTTVASAAPVTLREGLFAVVVANDQAVLAVGSTGAKPGSDLALWISCGTATR